MQAFFFTPKSYEGDNKSTHGDFRLDWTDVGSTGQ
jgi:hypothetical protein